MAAQKERLERFCACWISLFSPAQIFYKIALLKRTSRAVSPKAIVLPTGR